MNYDIRELRESTGMTQKAFASLYGIPVSTLRKWEYGEASPAPYVVNLIAGTLPYAMPGLKKIISKEGVPYYYDSYKKIVYDRKGNSVLIQQDLEDVKEQNLSLYLKDLFEGLYEIQEKFDRDCKFDKEEDIIWE